VSSLQNGIAYAPEIVQGDAPTTVPLHARRSCGTEGGGISLFILPTAYNVKWIFFNYYTSGIKKLLCATLL
jgi:hypothetical protein